MLIVLDLNTMTLGTKAPPWFQHLLNLSIEYYIEPRMGYSTGHKIDRRRLNWKIVSIKRDICTFKSGSHLYDTCRYVRTYLRKT